MDIELEVIQRVIDLKGVLDKLPKDERTFWGKLARYTKRLNNMIESEGMVRAMLFAYSRAKNRNVSVMRKYLSGGKLSDEEKKVVNNDSDSRIWMIIAAFLAENVFKEDDLLKILEKLEDENTRSRWELKSKMYLERMAYVFDALSE